MHAPFLAALLLALAAGLPAALAGSPEAPEVTDAEGDAACHGPLGNEYADLVAAWIDGETASSFLVHMALAKWTHDALGAAAGYTLQFTHQGVQFGAIAAYIPAEGGGEWEYSNGYIDTASGEMRDFRDAEGSFTPGSPALITVAFDKSLFPHGDAADNRLVDFQGGSADLKAWTPFFVAGQEPAVPFQVCDTVTGSAVYEFEVGGHSTHAPASEAAPGEEAPANATAPSERDDTLPPAATAGDEKTPGAPLVLALAAIGLLALALRRHGA